MDDVELKNLYPAELHPDLQASRDTFLQAWSTAKPLTATDPVVTGWNYAPWLSGTFKAHSERWSFTIFLGGLCRVTSPKGELGMFLLDAKVISGPGSGPPPR